MEATPGIEPGYADLQSAASPLRHVASLFAPGAESSHNRASGQKRAAEMRRNIARTGGIYHTLKALHKLAVMPIRSKRCQAGAHKPSRQHLLARLEALATRAKRDGLALYLAARHPSVPWGVKLFAVLVAAYVLSPIDLIPDFIPIIGFVDELLLLPVFVAVIVRFVDPAIMADLRTEAARLAERPQSLLGALIVLTAWAAAAGIIAWALWPHG